MVYINNSIIFFSFIIFYSDIILLGMGFLLLSYISFQMITGVLYSLNLEGMGVEKCYETKVYVFLNVNYGWLLMDAHAISPSYYFYFFYLYLVMLFFNMYFFMYQKC